MTISSRTPEGEPADCPVCRNHVAADPSINFGDAPCPHCGTLLWFVRIGSRFLFARRPQSADAQALTSLLANLIGVSEKELTLDPSLIEDADIDSLDLVEIMMEIERENG